MYISRRCIQCGACIEISGGAITPGKNHCIVDRNNIKNWDEIRSICPTGAYEQIGTALTSEEVVQKVMRDYDFFLTSGGGVTFSGGEPALQADFVRETAALLRSKGVSVAIDTAGMVPWEKMKRLLQEVDLVLYDIKAIDQEIHKKCTGVSNELILENAKKIAELGKDMWIRLVIVPGWNDDLEDIRKRLVFIKGLGESIRRVDILKYHSLGAGKYEQLGLSYKIPSGTKCSEILVQAVLNLAKEEHVEVNFEN